MLTRQQDPSCHQEASAKVLVPSFRQSFQHTCRPCFPGSCSNMSRTGKPLPASMSRGVAGKGVAGKGSRRRFYLNQNLNQTPCEFSVRPLITTSTNLKTSSQSLPRVGCRDINELSTASRQLTSADGMTCSVLLKMPSADVNSLQAVNVLLDVSASYLWE